MTFNLLITLANADSLVWAVATFLLLFWCGVWVVHVGAIVYGYYIYIARKFRKVDPDKKYPPVSIIKPLTGMDANLYSNLETFFVMDYPDYELLFCVHTSSDPALDIVRSLIASHPHIKSKIFIGGETVGVNPKINNMLPAYRAAENKLILISDMALRMRPDSLKDMVDQMTDKVGCVTQMPNTMDRSGFAATLEKVYFGTMHARMYLNADWVGIICSTGMSSLLRKDVLDTVGGIHAFGMYLAEDYFFAKTLVNKGYQCALATQTACQNPAVVDVSRFLDRLSRWCKLRQAMLPHTIVLEPLQDCMLLGVLCSWATNYLFGWNSLVFFLVHILVWMLLDYVLLRVVQRGGSSPVLPFSKFEFVVSWLYRECAALPIAVVSVVCPTIEWRASGPYRLRWGGQIDTRTVPAHVLHKLPPPPYTERTLCNSFHHAITSQQPIL